MFSVASLVVVAIYTTYAIIRLVASRTSEAIAEVSVAGVLFVPQFAIDLPFQVMTKPVLITFICLLGVVVSKEDNRIWRPIGVAELSILMMVMAGLGSSLTNGLGPYDAVVSAKNLVVNWGLPCFIGRCAFSKQLQAESLLRACVAGAVLYLPLVLFEMKFAPVLHVTLFGYTPRGVNDFVHAVRFGFWRPTVFMNHGLELSLFLGLSSVAAYWLAVARRPKFILGVPVSVCALVLLVATLFCFSSGAIVLTISGWFLITVRHLRVFRILFLLLCLAPAAYQGYRLASPSRVVSVGEGSPVGEVARAVDSLNTRLNSERIFLSRVWDNPVFGRSVWYLTDTGDEKAIPDALWVIMVGAFGFLGWIGWNLYFLSGVFASMRRVKPGHGMDVGVCMLLMVVLFWCDCMLNAFVVVLYPLMLGAIVGQFASPELKAEFESGRHEFSSAETRVARRMWPAAKAVVSMSSAYS